MSSRTLHLTPRDAAQALTSDLVIIFALHPDLTPAFAECAAKSGAGAIIVSGSDTAELRRGASTYQIPIHADEICCSLVPCHNRVIDKSTSVLGMPVFRILVESGLVSDVEVMRGSLCGASWWVASQLPGKSRVACGAVPPPCRAWHTRRNPPIVRDPQKSG